MIRQGVTVLVAVLAATIAHVGAASADHRPDQVVVVGGTSSLTGRYSGPAGRHINGWKLNVDELNTRGGLLGHKVELRISDDKSDRRTAIELYETLVAEGGIDLFIGPYGSHLTDAVANVMERHRRPFIANASSKVIWERGRRFVFNYSAIARNYLKGAVHLANQIGLKRIAIIGEGSVFPRQVAEGALEWARILGLDVVLLESYHRRETDFTALLRKVEASGAEAIISASYHRDSVAQVRQLRQLNIDVKLFAATVGPALPGFVEELGKAAEFVVGFSQWKPNPVLGFRGMKEFIENYKNRYGVIPNYHAANGYQEAQILAAVVKQAGSFDPEKVRDAYSSVAVETIMGRWKVNSQGLNNREGVTFQIQNGKRVLVWPAHVAQTRFLVMPKREERAKK